MPNASYDTLTIKINADSKQANSSIKQLASNLNKLNDAISNLDKERVMEVETLLKRIASIDFSNVSKGLQSVVIAFKQFERVGKRIETIKQDNKMPNALNIGSVANSIQPSDMSFNSLNVDNVIKEYQNKLNTLSQSATKSLSNISFPNFEEDIRTLKDDFSELGEETQTSISPLEEKLSSLRLNANQLEVVFNAINKSLGEISNEQLKQVEQVLKESGLSAKEVEKTLKQLGKETQKVKPNGLKQLGNQFKNILKYRVIRKVIQQIFAEITNAFNELASVDDDFNKALGEIKSAFSYIARVLTSVIAPIIKLIAPLISAVASGVGSVVSELGSSLSGALGNDTFAEAKENVETYTDSINKAKKAQTSLGIDELNVVSQEDSKTLFEEKQTTATNDLSKTMGDLIEAIKPIFNSLKNFVEAIRPILNIIISLLQQAFGETMDSVNESVSAVINAISTIFGVISSLLTAFKPFIDLIISISDFALNLINSVITTIATLIDFFLQPLMPILDGIGEILKLIEPALKVISELLKGLTGRSDNKGVRIASGILTGGLSELFRAMGQNAKGYATGGFPEDGLFFANHSELVGSFSNGRTAVANNMQIIEGIKQGVLEAMQQSNSGGINVYLDSHEISSIIEKRQNNRGANVVYGGNINYGR